MGEEEKSEVEDMYSVVEAYRSRVDGSLYESSMIARDHDRKVCRGVLSIVTRSKHPKVGEVDYLMENLEKFKEHVMVEFKLERMMFE